MWRRPSRLPTICWAGGAAGLEDLCEEVEEALSQCLAAGAPGRSACGVTRSKGAAASIRQWPRAQWETVRDVIYLPE
jgi:hypothetical protein